MKIESSLKVKESVFVYKDFMRKLYNALNAWFNAKHVQMLLLVINAKIQP
jgi:hypothetical protein